MELLFWIDKPFDHGSRFDDSFKVKKVCDDPVIVEKYKDEDMVETL